MMPSGPFVIAVSLLLSLSPTAVLAQSCPTVTCLNTTGTGPLSTALGMETHSLGAVSTAMGYNTTAAGRSSHTFGVNTRTINDPKVPGGDSCGGCIAAGFNTAAQGDWSVAMGSDTWSRGYASMALGYQTHAMTFGEVALGLYTELSNHTEEELRNQSVIGIFNEHDPVLRVGIGCVGTMPAGGTVCKKGNQRLDALRVYKNGALYLKKPNGRVIPDVQDSLESCHAKHEETKQELKLVKQENEATKEELEAVKKTLAALTDRIMKLERTAVV